MYHSMKSTCKKCGKVRILNSDGECNDCHLGEKEKRNPKDIRHLPADPAKGMFLFFALEAIIAVLCYLDGETVGYYWVLSIVLRVILQCAYYSEELYYPWWIAFTSIISYKLEAAVDWHRMSSSRAFVAVVAIEIIAIIIAVTYTHVVCSIRKQYFYSKELENSSPQLKNEECID